VFSSTNSTPDDFFGDRFHAITRMPLPVDHPLTKLPNVTLSAHSAFRTPEASENLIGAAWDHCRRIAKG